MSGCILAPLPHPALLLYWILSLGSCTQPVLPRLSQAQRYSQRAGVEGTRGVGREDGGRVGGMVVTSIIHHGIAKETGCEGIAERDQ